MQFYYFVDGERKGPANAAQLKTLAALGKIDKETEIELEDGRRLPARKIKGIVFKGETPDEKADAGEIYGVAEPVAPPILASESSAPPKMEEEAFGDLGVAPDVALSETTVPPVDVPIPAPFPAQPVARPETPATKGKMFGANVVLFALSGVFLMFALVSAIVGFAQLAKTQTALVGEECEPVAPVSEKKENRKNDAENERKSDETTNEITNARLDELDDERKKRLDFLEELLGKGLLNSESDLMAYKSRGIWQKSALDDARRRPSVSIEAYMDALDRLDFDKHEFVGGDAYNLGVNASLFTGFGVLGVGTDVRDVGDKVRALGTDVRDVGDKVRALGTDVRDVGEKVKTINTNLRAVGTDVQAVGTSVRSASAVIAAGAGFVCAALFASTSALLLALGLLARRTSAV